MRTFHLLLACSIALTGSVSAESRPNTARLLAALAVSADRNEAAAAIADLRARGPAGLESLLETHAELLNRGPAPADPAWQRLTNALDAVSGQRDSYASQLYWYTDLDQAITAARLSGKPILSLRLLGRLDEDLSCANSRLFRITLYANQRVSGILRDRFVLHWKSERPVPKVTIDFGDGRKLERTITGNSIHYVLDSTGRPVEALPGLYGSGVFIRWLEQSEQLVRALAGMDPGVRDAALKQHHAGMWQAIESQWRAELTGAGLPASRLPAVALGDPSAPVPARKAAPRAYTKVIMEKPILRGVLNDRDFPALVGDEERFARIAVLHGSDASLDNATRALIMNKLPDKSPENLQRAISNLERAIAIDSVRNEYLFRVVLHQWFVAGGQTGDLEALNARVYAQLFLTPSTDPWLGLVTPETYVGIDNEGIRR